MFDEFYTMICIFTHINCKSSGINCCAQSVARPLLPKDCAHARWPPIHRTLVQQTFFYESIWKLTFLLISSLILTALKMQFVMKLRMLHRTLYVASWQVYLGDGSNALIVMEDISKTLYWRCAAFLWIQDTGLLNRVQLYLLLCTINVLSYFQNG